MAPPPKLYLPSPLDPSSYLDAADLNSAKSVLSKGAIAGIVLAVFAGAMTYPPLVQFSLQYNYMKM
ncbi:hypothetical protein Sjap_025591 [Stephania japonica]|uniref:Uncharacterized protein n=1 Tax=Stephania japonica TaxID=461633 RepID=A0AAP0E1W6_9MAGN